MWATTGLLATIAAAAVAVIATVATARAGTSTTAWIVGGVGAIVVVGLASASAARVILDYKNFRYEVADLGLYVSRGWLWKSWQIVPHSRVQTVDTNAGPLHRLFGLVTVHVTTASAAGGTAIPGLAPPVASALVEELARRAELDEGT
jgi:membrane protein YdbS with pleckstrin-like domain